MTGLKAALVAKGWPTHQLIDEFAPQRLYYWIKAILLDYRSAQRPSAMPWASSSRQVGWSGLLRRVHDLLGK